MIINLDEGTVCLGWFKNGYFQLKSNLEGDFVLISDLYCTNKEEGTIEVGSNYKLKDGKTALKRKTYLSDSSSKSIDRPIKDQIKD